MIPIVIEIITWALGLLALLLYSTVVLCATNAYRREHGHACWFCETAPCTCKPDTTAQEGGE